MVLSEKEQALQLGISICTMRRFRLAAGCPHFTVGKRIFYRPESVAAWMEGLENKVCKSEAANPIREIR